MRGWLLALGVLLGCVGAPAQERSLDVAVADAGPVPLAPYFSVLVDDGRQLTLADVRQPAMQARFAATGDSTHALNYGFTRSAYWFRLNLQNGAGMPVERLIELSFTMLSQIDFFEPRTMGGYRTVSTGLGLPFSTRAYPNRFFVFPVNLSAGASETVYFRVQSENGILMPATLWEPEAFRTHERDEYLLQAAYFGLATALVLYNLLLFFTLHDRVYGLYAVFATMMALAISAVNGFAAEYLWPEASVWSHIAFNVLYSLAMAAQIMFIRHTLDLRTLAPRVDRYLSGLGVLMLLLPIAFYESLATFAWPVSMGWAATGLLLMGVLLYAGKVKKQRLALPVGIAFSMLLLGGLMVELKTLAFIPHNGFTQQGLQLGSALEMVLLAFSLAYRFNLIRHEATAAVERSNADLALHLQAKEAELTAIHLKLLESDRLQTISQERQRFMQDMHDGVGSSLTTALRMVERGRLQEAAVAQVLKSCIDDLKLAIDSMEPVEADLLLLLATLRFRIGPRLEEGGIRLKWHVGQVAALEWLEPKSSLHILRILQEAFANIIKHADATEIVVATWMQADHVAISVRDNGNGFPTTRRSTPSGGRGLANQRRRAQDIGGTVRWESSGTGTCLTLLLPIKPR